MAQLNHCSRSVVLTVTCDQIAHKRSFQSAVDGSLNILKQAEKAGIKKVVVTGSIVSVYNDRNSFTSKGPHLDYKHFTLLKYRVARLEPNH